MRATLKQVLPQAFSQEAFWVSADIPAGASGVPLHRYLELLGKDIPLLIYDTLQGYNPDCMGAISGTVPAGGIFVLLTQALCQPDCFSSGIDGALENEPLHSQRFSAYFSETLVRTDAFTVYEQSTAPNTYAPIKFAGSQRELVEKTITETEDQSIAVSAVIKVANGHRKRPLVLTADRGRGKTSALGIAAAQLLLERPRRIIITGPRWSAVETAFLHAEKGLSDSEKKLIKEKHALFVEGGELTYVAPDVLASDARCVDLLLVDEAAALPAPVLYRLLQRHSRIVFSSTIHGYEGTGRGFEIRFKSMLNRLTPQWRGLHMHTPIRWSSGDPLEAFVFDSLLLNAETCSAEIALQCDADDLQFIELDLDSLAKDRQQLKELFGLMVLAHYRTSPNDLRTMLDTPGVRLFALINRGHIIAASWLVEEGGLSDKQTESIRQGQCRLKGHLVVQSLMSQFGLLQAAQLRSARIVRVAVHPEVQQQGLGKRLITSIIGVIRDDFDFISSSFGATLGLNKFWRECGFYPFRLGFKREASSGEHALMVGLGVNEEGASLIASANGKFHRDFPLQVSEYFSEVTVKLLIELLINDNKRESHALTDDDTQALDRFVLGYQAYEGASVPIWRYLVHSEKAMTAMQGLDDIQQQVLVSKVLLKKDWKDITLQYGLRGKKEVLALLRAGLSSIMTN